MPKIIRNRLTAQQVKNAKDPGMMGDGGGLYLQVSKTGTKSWIVKVQIKGGKRRELGLGGYPLVSLADARKKADDYRKVALEGRDPTVLLQQKAAVPTFEEAVEQYVKDNEAGWRGPYTASRYRTSMKTHTKHLAKIKVSDITPADIEKTLKPIWQDTPAIAKLVGQRIAQILDKAVALDQRPGNPTQAVMKMVLGKQGYTVKHHKALSYSGVPQFIQNQLPTFDCLHDAKAVIEFIALTAVRSGEASGPCG